MRRGASVFPLNLLWIVIIPGCILARPGWDVPGMTDTTVIDIKADPNAYSGRTVRFRAICKTEGQWLYEPGEKAVLGGYRTRAVSLRVNWDQTSPAARKELLVGSSDSFTTPLLGIVGTVSGLSPLGDPLVIVEKVIVLDPGK